MNYAQKQFFLTLLALAIFASFIIPIARSIIKSIQQRRKDLTCPKCKKVNALKRTRKWILESTSITNEQNHYNYSTNRNDKSYDAESGADVHDTWKFCDYESTYRQTYVTHHDEDEK